MNGFFITGTDTGVGKTFATCALARLARARGLRVFAFKPIETGCALLEGRRVGADQQLLAEAAGDWQQGDLGGVYRLLQPAAPLVAATAEGIRIDLDRILAVLAEGAARAELTLVEGAGGWRVPITEAEDMGSLARRLALPVIVVARAGLGTINHSLLTIEAIERDGLPVASLLLSRRPEDDEAFTRSNADEIRRRWPGRVEVIDAPGTGFVGLVPPFPPVR